MLLLNDLPSNLLPPPRPGAVAEPHAAAPAVRTKGVSLAASLLSSNSLEFRLVHLAEK